MTRPSGLSPKRRSWLRLSLVVGVALLVVSAGYFTYSVLIGAPKDVTKPPEETEASQSVAKKPEKKVPQASADSTTVVLPGHLSIPAAGVDGAAIEQLGVEANGDLAAPLTNEATGWYTKSAMPGSGKGAVLINGHVGITGQPGVFQHLEQVKVGDVITVSRTDGKNYTYKVYDTEQLPIAKVDMSKMMRSVDPAREGLNIITCSGAYDASQTTYDQRLLVYAVLID